MPRTKIPKNSKRNREVANREEKVRLYELKMDSRLISIDSLETKFLSAVDHQVKTLLGQVQKELANLKMPEVLRLFEELDRFSDFKASDQTQLLASMSMSGSATEGHAPSTTGSRNDEEDSSIGASGGSILAAHTGSLLRSTKAMRTPGPLHSARARRARRSRSACGDLNILHSAKPPSISSSSSSRNSRSKLRTPMASRAKAFSADRTPLKQKQMRPGSPTTPPMAFLRYPKPGEVALSKYGSPMVAQVMPDKFANVNIPIRNGVLSLRPKKLDADEVESNLLENLDEDTLNQIKTLHENLQMIVNKASQAVFK
ncbi:borealin isoform X2 [Drosophila sechellia]|uniref:GM12517 n=1 Tax=Drosophila sechellia TaxID=7238 RepID=B4HYV8_DROSE|nr:borealin isoform X2 [Drosophila sechellia]EDW52238.1 GM12517 [Drosophila sechellia]